MRWGLVCIVPVIAGVAIWSASAADLDPVPLFTGEDLDRMFGPVPARSSDPVDKSRPEDWRWVEDFLARQYSRIDADRQYELSSRSVDIAAEQVDHRWPVYGGYVAWGLGYPASTWWNRVWSSYAAGTSVATCRTRDGRFDAAGDTSQGRERRGGDGRGRGTLNSGRSMRMR
jgi:hypothetical protein